MRAQVPLTELVTDVRRVPGAAGSGWSSAQIDVQHNSVHLYWHGSVPDKVTKLVDGSRAAGIMVDLSQAPYTWDQLQAARDSFTTQHAQPGVTPQPGEVSSVQINVDGSGLTVGVAPGATATRTTKASLTSTVHVDVVTDDAAPAPIASRNTDRPWFNAGGLIRQSNTSTSCTSTFGLHDQSSVNGGAGRRYMLTAAHCGWATWQSGDRAATIGRTVYLNKAYDVQVISGYTTGYTFLGPAFNQTDYNITMPMRAWTDEVPGSLVCNSGAWSGEICLIQVDGWPSEAWNTFGMVPIHSINGVAVGGPGDSGAPVFSFTTDSSAGVAAGMMDAINPSYKVPCIANNDGRVCASRGWYVSFGSALTALSGVGQGGLSLNTN